MTAADEQAETPKKEEALPTLTNQTCADEVNQLIDRYTAANLKPLPVLAAILAKRGMGLLDQTRASLADMAERFLVSIESGNAKETKK